MVFPFLVYMVINSEGKCGLLSHDPVEFGRKSAVFFFKSFLD